MTDATKAGEYVTDVAYIRHFCDDLAPTQLRLAAGLNGFEAPRAASFDYCELGCGNGDTLVALAAAHPSARFVGVDLIAEHVAHATALAKDGGVENVRFLEGDFETLERADLPSFDYVTANGVLSWVGPAKRRAVFDFAREKLREGGLLYVSYNALPGSAAIEPLRRLLVDTTRKVEGGSLERALHGVKLAQLLAAGGAAYFKANPYAKRTLDTMMGGGLAYVVHEYFHSNWHSMYFGDVARELADHGLFFVGQLPAHLNYRDLTIPGALLDLFKMIDDRLLFESLKDYAVNESFRRDVYVKGTAARSDATTRRFLDETPFGTLVSGGRIQREVRLPACTMRFDGAFFEALTAALSWRAQRVVDLVADGALRAYEPSRIRDGVRNLVVSGQLTPMVEATTEPPRGAAFPPRHRIPLAYNRMVVGQPLRAETPFILASARAGTGVEVPMLEAICIRCVVAASAKERPKLLHDMISEAPLDMKVAGRAVTDPEEQEAILAGELVRFSADRLPKLVELGVLEIADV